MRFKDHIKLAAFTGLLVGIFHGLVDIIIRVILWLFEWFELYQTLLISSITFTILFTIIGLIFGIITKIIKLKLSKEAYFNFYFSTSIILLLLFYIETIVNRDFLAMHTFFSKISLSVNIPILLFFGMVYVFLLSKAKGNVINFLSLFRREKPRKIINNIVFIITIFVVSSIVLDLFMLKSSTSTKTDPSLDDKPNIILISMDAVRADHLSLYGYPLETSPSLDRLSTESVVFENAISQSSWSLLSHGSLLTGKYVSNYDPQVLSDGISNNQTTIAEMLRKKGYNTAGFVSMPWIKAKYGFGQGFVTYKDRMDFFEQGRTYEKFSIKGSIFTFLPIFKPITGIDEERLADETNALVYKWLDKNKNSRFFLFVHYFDPHAPYEPKDEFRKKFTEDPRGNDELEREYKKTSKKKRYGNVSQDVVDSLTKLYDAEIYGLDYEINKLLEKLEELNLMDNTIIFITADHGEEFYEHGYFKHSRALYLYQEIIHVPLIIHYPKAFSAKRVDDRVGILDIYPTILDILNIDIPDDVDGVSLLPLIISKGQYNRESLKSEIPGVQDNEENQQTVIISGDWKLIEVKKKSEEIPSLLFNLRSDPEEKKNLYDVFPEKRESLKRHISNSSD